MSETRIGVISDTHYTPHEYTSAYIQSLCKKLELAFAKTGLIIHCGDVTSQEMLDMLSEIAPVEAVAGNTDAMGTCGHLPRIKLITVSDMNIGIIHGFGSPGGFPEKLQGSFDGFSSLKGGKLDVLAFGHTHTPFNKLINGVLCFNPGSAVKPRAGFPASVGILTIASGRLINGEIINL